MIQRGGTEPAWQAWTAIESAHEIPGAFTFTRQSEAFSAMPSTSRLPLHRLNTDLCPVVTHTMVNLSRLGFPRDFLPAATVERWRTGQAPGEELFGERWFILPNPVYGSW